MSPLRIWFMAARPRTLPAAVAPVLILAGLVTLVAVSPRAPGSVSVILATMCGGSEIDTGLPL